MGDLWAEWGWVGDGFGVGIIGDSGDGFGGSLGTVGWVWGWGIFGQSRDGFGVEIFGDSEDGLGISGHRGDGFGGPWAQRDGFGVSLGRAGMGLGLRSLGTVRMGLGDHWGQRDGFGAGGSLDRVGMWWGEDGWGIFGLG